MDFDPRFDLLVCHLFIRRYSLRCHTASVFFLLGYSTKPDRYRREPIVSLLTLREAISSLGCSYRLHVSGRDLDLYSLYGLHYGDLIFPLALGTDQIADAEEAFTAVEISYGSHANPP